MAYGDKMRIGTIKKSEMHYEHTSDRIFGDSPIKAQFINATNWVYSLEFKNRKDWFRFVRDINKMNGQFKRMKNIEEEDKI